MDLFRDKLATSPIRKYFADYDGDERDERTACGYFKTKFLELCRDPKKEIYTHFTNATDTNLLKITMASVQDMIIQRSLNNLYFA
ncbi:G-Protein alpha subunit [Trichoglossum hirsutum]|uniref:G-Protein alpha subunit n=1 Tax=Trichoglossum hirsutum TaxID=265104 RepID=A0A9P8RNG1_9PEZI|nr:G-Protein alpha subunit [Trichoglossum hirsutum]